MQKQGAHIFNGGSISFNKKLSNFYLQLFTIYGQTFSNTHSQFLTYSNHFKNPIWPPLRSSLALSLCHLSVSNSFTVLFSTFLSHLLTPIHNPNYLHTLPHQHIGTRTHTLRLNTHMFAHSLSPKQHPLTHSYRTPTHNLTLYGHH